MTDLDRLDEFGRSPHCTIEENDLIQRCCRLIESQAAQIAALEAKLQVAVDDLDWYGEQARLARLIHSEGDSGRNALASDGGKRARQALATIKETP